MKKFNEFEKGLLFDALKAHGANLEEEVASYSDKGKNCLFAPGYFDLVIGELLDKVNSMTKKK